ncbi:MAG: hypothetical protein U0359_00515 [Byssovorax sp.]
MNRARVRIGLLAAALTLSLTGMVFGRSTVGPAPAAYSGPVPAVDAFTVAERLAGVSPEVVVITLDPPVRHPLRGALPASSFGPDDEALVAGAPRSRELILAGVDPLRVDRAARRLLASGRRVAVLEGGVAAWDLAMDADPPAPAANAPAATWQTYRSHVALRRSFGDAAAAPAPTVAAPAPALAAPSGAAKKREGC